MAENKYDIHIDAPIHGLTIGDNANVGISLNDASRTGESKQAPLLLPPPSRYPLIGRDALITDLKKQLFSSRTTALRALNGIPGVGKTALALALVHDEEVQRHFSDGILWASVGQKSNVTAQLSEWCAALGLPQTLADPTAGKEQLGRAIRATMGMRRMLLVIDDVWTVDDALAFQVGGVLCSYILTTRSQEVAVHFTCADVTPVPELSMEHGVQLLEHLAPKAVEADRIEAILLVGAVGGLPLALTIMGSYLRHQSNSGQSRRIREALDGLLQTEERLKLEMRESPGATHVTITDMSQVSSQVSQNHIAYYRVSTDRQGRSGLGLDAQRQAVSLYLVGRGELVAEFTEVESGGKADRPELAQALVECRRQKARLVIAKLDRLARNVHFISGLLESGVDFIAVDMPEANRLTIHILAAVAEHEREMISKRTKEALAAAKRRGKRLGNPAPAPSLARGRATNEANLNTHRQKITPLIQQLRREGKSLRAIAAELNAKGIPTARGRKWHPETVDNVLKSKKAAVT